MGRIFLAEQIPDGIPQNIKKDFGTVMRYFREMIGVNDHFIGAIVYGSVPAGTMTIRSDFDALVLYDGKSENELSPVVRHFGKIAKEIHIPLQVIYLNSEDAARGIHTLSPFFVEELRFAVRQGWWIKNDPLSFISGIDEEKKWQHLAAYAAVKLDTFERGLFAFHSLQEHEICVLLANAFDAPFHLMRKFYDLHGKDGLARETKSNLINQTVQTSFIGELVEDFRNATALLGDILSQERQYDASLAIYRRNLLYQEDVSHLLLVTLPHAIDFMRFFVRYLRDYDGLLPAVEHWPSSSIYI